jgi:hypothetical protein
MSIKNNFEWYILIYVIKNLNRNLYKFVLN